MASDSRIARLSIDVSPELRRRIRILASAHDTSIRDYVVEAIQERVDREFKAEGLVALTAAGDPVLAELWNNEKDAAYDKL